MSNKREEYLRYHFGDYEDTSLENRMKISLTKRCFQNMIRFYYYVEENFIAVYDKEKKHPNVFIRYRKSETLRNELDMNGVLDEYLEMQHKNTLENESQEGKITQCVNGKLIAAAPDLLKVCQEMIKALKGLSNGDEITKEILQAENNMYEAVNKAM